MAKFKMTKMPKLSSSAKIKTRVSAPKVRTKVKPKIESKFSSKLGHSISTKDLSARQAKSLLKLQTKYELARAKAGIMSEAAMKHHENMAKIKGRTATNISAMTQAAGSATTLGGTALLSNKQPTTTNAQIQVNGGMSNATQGRDPSSTQTQAGSSGSKPGSATDDKQWSDIIDNIGRQ